MLKNILILLLKLLNNINFEIIKMIDFERTNPKYLYFEHQHLTIKEFKQAVELLDQKGFDFVTDKTDTFAFKKGLSVD